MTKETLHREVAVHLVACLPRLRRYARALLGERAAADDLVQDTVERGWLKISTWRGGDMRAWLFGIMHNLHVDQLRKGKLTTVDLDEQAVDMVSVSGPAEKVELLDLEDALGRLPAEQREVLLLVALEEMRYEDVATALGIPIGTVMSRLSRARERLRAEMEGRSLASPLKVVK